MEGPFIDAAGEICKRLRAGSCLTIALLVLAQENKKDGAFLAHFASWWLALWLWLWLGTCKFFLMAAGCRLHKNHDRTRAFVYFTPRSGRGWARAFFYSMARPV
jgi:hypothetical protein